MAVVLDFLCCIYSKNVNIYHNKIDRNFHSYTISEDFMRRGQNDSIQEEEANASNILNETEENTVNANPIDSMHHKNTINDNSQDNVLNKSLNGVTYAKISFPIHPKFMIPPEKSNDDSNGSDHSSLINKSMAVPLHYLSVEDVRQRLHTLKSFQTTTTTSNGASKTESISSTNSRTVLNYADQETVQVSVQRAQSPESHL